MTLLRLSAVTFRHRDTSSWWRCEDRLERPGMPGKLRIVNMTSWDNYRSGLSNL
jgi:hypothetical protein